MLTDALEEVSRAIKLFELFKQSGYFLQDLSIYHESSALIHALRKEYDDALDELEAACKYALKCDTVRSNEKYKLFGNIVDEDNVVYNERKDMLAALLSSERNDIYAPIKDTQRYKDIIKALEES